MECTLCKFKFKNKLSKSLHIKNNHNLSLLEYSLRYENFKIPKCEICNSSAKHNKGIKFYKTCGNSKCKSQIQKNKIIPEAVRKKISKSRKKFLKENPEKHVWKNNNKFISMPCEYVKKILIKNNINFVEEFSISNIRHYSVDILITEKNLIIEVNGNQHYDKNGKLKEYYQIRHDFIKSLGFNIIELPYYQAYDEIQILKIVNSYNKSYVLPFFKKEKKKPKYGSIKEYQYARKKKYNEESIKIIEELLNSDINFSNYGWVSKASVIIGISPQQVKKWFERNMPDFYKNNCYKRK